jgi:hypothetical protein
MRGLVLAMVLAPVVIDECPLSPRRDIRRNALERIEERLRSRPPMVLRRPSYAVELIPLWEGQPPVILIPTEWPPMKPVPLRP